jgi:HSP20 family protein
MSLSIIPRGRAGYRGRPAHFVRTGEVDRFFEDFFGPSRATPAQSAAGERHGFVPKLDVSESDEAYTVSAELPGVARGDFEVVLEDNVLTLKGEKKSDEDSEENGARRSEMRFGSFERRVAFRNPIAEDDVKARYVDGLLAITIPKPLEERPKVRTVPIENA